jgi:hypothetical protein
MTTRSKDASAEIELLPDGVGVPQTSTTLQKGLRRNAPLHLTLNAGASPMSHQEQITAITDELTNAIQAVVETFEPYRADHRPDCTDTARWLIWNNKTSERLGVIALAGEQEHALTLIQQKVLLRTRAMDLLRNVA